MNLTDWRNVLANGISTGLSVPERGYVFPVYHYYTPELQHLPCIVLQPGGPGGADYTYDIPGDPDDMLTFCQFMARFTLWILIAEPNTENAADLLDDIVYRLHTGALDACKTDELNTIGFVPAVRGASQVYNITYADRNVLATALDLVVPII